MPVVQRVSSLSEIPRGRKHVLVTLGEKDELIREGENLIVTVDRALPDNAFEARLQRRISDAELAAIQEDVDVVFVCAEARRLD